MVNVSLVYGLAAFWFTQLIPRYSVHSDRSIQSKKTQSSSTDKDKVSFYHYFIEG